MRAFFLVALRMSDPQNFVLDPSALAVAIVLTVVVGVVWWLMGQMHDTSRPTNK